MPLPHLPRVVDSHQHVFWQGRDDVGLIQDMDENGIDFAWLLSWEIAPSEHEQHYVKVLNPMHVRPDGTHRGIPLEDLVIARDRYPDRFALGFCPHPLMGDAVSRLQAAAGVHGVRICGEWKFRIPFDDPRCILLFRAAGELGMPVVLHLDVPFRSDGKGGVTYDPIWYGGTVENLQRALQACPETIFIGHAPGFWREISGNADEDPSNYPSGPVVGRGKLYDLFEHHPNLYADLSAGSGRMALSRDPEHARLFLESFSERLLFARDYYGGELHAFLSQLDLKPATRSAIYHGNAERLVPSSPC